MSMHTSVLAILISVATLSHCKLLGKEECKAYECTVTVEHGTDTSFELPINGLITKSNPPQSANCEDTTNLCIEWKNGAAFDIKSIKAKKEDFFEVIMDGKKVFTRIVKQNDTDTGCFVNSTCSSPPFIRVDKDGKIKDGLLFYEGMTPGKFNLYWKGDRTPTCITTKEHSVFGIKGGMFDLPIHVTAVIDGKDWSFLFNGPPSCCHKLTTMYCYPENKECIAYGGRGTLLDVKVPVNADITDSNPPPKPGCSPASELCVTYTNGAGINYGKLPSNKDRKWLLITKENNAVFTMIRNWTETNHPVCFKGSTCSLPHDVVMDTKGQIRYTFVRIATNMTIGDVTVLEDNGTLHKNQKLFQRGILEIKGKLETFPTNVTATMGGVTYTMIFKQEPRCKETPPQ